MTGCRFCRGPIGEELRADAVYCGQACRQAGFRLRRRRVTDARHAEPMRLAYADPPYPGKAYKYRGEASYGGEVDHRELIARLRRDFPDGWALSTSEDALRAVLPLCPPGVHLCPWVKPNGVSGRTNGLHNAWEALLVVGGRQRPPGVRDWLRAKPAIGGGTLVGRKPLAFCAWLFDCLGMVPGDELVDLYPGTGVVGRTWSLLCTEASDLRSAEPSPEAYRPASLAADRHASPGAARHASSLQPGDASRRTSRDGSVRARGITRSSSARSVLPRQVETNLVLPELAVTAPARERDALPTSTGDASPCSRGDGFSADPRS